MEKHIDHSLKLCQTEIIYFPSEQIGEFWIFRLNNYIGIRYNIRSKLTEFYTYKDETEIKFYDGDKIGEFTIPDNQYINIICDMYISGYDTFKKCARSFMLKRGIPIILLINLFLFALNKSIIALLIGISFGIGYIIYKSIIFRPNSVNCTHIVQVIKKFCNEKFENS